MSFLTAKVKSTEAAIDLKTGCDIREERKRERNPPSGPNQRVFSGQMLAAASERSEPKSQLGCPCCDQAHLIINCPRYFNMDIRKRWTEFRANPKMYKSCIRCLGFRFGRRGHGHFCSQVCSVEGCGRNHHALLHEDITNEEANSAKSSALLTSSKVLKPVRKPKSSVQKKRILQIVGAIIRAGLKTCKIWVGLDSFATHSYVRKDIVKRVDIPVLETIHMEVHGFGGKVSKGDAEVMKFDLVSSDEVMAIMMNAIVKTRKICSPLPPIALGQTELSCLTGLNVADGMPEGEVEVDVLLGADQCWQIIKQTKPVPGTNLVVLDTVFGPVLTGTHDINYEEQRPSNCHRPTRRP